MLAERLLGLVPSEDITFIVFVHFGTLMSVIVSLRKEIGLIIKETFEVLFKWKISKVHFDQNENFRLAVFILVGSIPAAVIGLLYEDAIALAFTDAKLVAVMLVLTGLILFLTRLAEPLTEKKFGFVSAFVVGIAQAFAIIPGISRSGTTISTAMYLRIPPVKGATFSFLLSVPVILGATLLKIEDILVQGIVMDSILIILAGTLASFVAGYIAINALLKIVQQGRFSVFAFYCLLVGILGILFV